MKPFAHRKPLDQGQLRQVATVSIEVRHAEDVEAGKAVRREGIVPGIGHRGDAAGASDTGVRERTPGLVDALPRSPCGQQITKG